MNRLLLVRHTQVARRWTGRCYGHSNAGLSRDGHAAALVLAEKLAALKPDHIVCSDLRRTAILAAMVGRLAGITPSVTPVWRERDYGEWEGKTWHRIWQESGNAMDGMLSDPEYFRPGGGETTAELVARSRNAWQALPKRGTVLVISHGGPIAALRWHASSLPVPQIVDFIPALGTFIEHEV